MQAKKTITKRRSEPSFGINVKNIDETIGNQIWNIVLQIMPVNIDILCGERRKASRIMGECRP